MIDLIHEVNRIRNVPQSELAPEVKNVLVILCNPRSGSSLLASMLSTHPDIASLDGEIEPFLILTKNGFGFNSDSDAIRFIENKAELANNIFDNLTVPDKNHGCLDLLKIRWQKRCLLQFPSLFSNELAYHKLIQNLHDAACEIEQLHITDEHEVQKRILAKVFKNESWRINYYDGKLRAGMRKSFNETLKIEEPPFVTPRFHRRPFTADDAKHKMLMFKAPPDAYRMGMYEQIFSNADIKYLHITRGYAQSVNGLMDGWLSPVAFFSHHLGNIGVQLNIKGYSDTVHFGKKWWKFDLPPHWRELISSPLEDVCLHQWLAPHRAIIRSGVPVMRMQFEDLLRTPVPVFNKITSFLGLSEIELQPSLPVTMATEAPKLKRWKKREALLLSMAERNEVRTMMEQLGYEMHPDSWI